jgi:hypothetical protein
VTKPASPSNSGVAVLVFDVGRIGSGATASTGKDCRVPLAGTGSAGSRSYARVPTQRVAASPAAGRAPRRPSDLPFRPGELIHEQVNGRR